ncbi:NAD-dependent succinate-semialdehyde dehydrogenase (plasmid) [Chelatococcus daeguensis]|uniref:NAD-dependent succinate-semialdehyde dehydrogenase n=1 Tax=Chelatococcus daeguensis TaxID=444444 RepID=A0AAC9JS81_9HYPH|nr:NAD-dependent succinate-semialdehyde dehydrogenase [Chelatococcus daeguensis]APF39312.1 NAD-dependent succinate-semialdehyde dehydrogenase [Chelatococcus daeguensis]
MNAHAATAHAEQHPQHHPGYGRLKDPRLMRTLGYVDGRWTAAPDGAVFDVNDPADGTLVARVAALGADAADAAVAAAHRAFPAWRALLPQERAARLGTWYDLIMAAREDLAVIMVMEQGKPLAEARGEIDYAASFVAWYAEEAVRVNVEGVTSHLAHAEMMVRREPVGVAALLTPWNFPSAMLTRKAAAALAAGCTVVAHPSSYTPLSALALAELGERAGLPGGVFNIVTGDAATIAGRFCEDERVRAVSFTGSTEIGRQVAMKAAAGMKRLVLELGGHAPLIIFDDADLDRAVAIAIDAKFATSGQDCLAANRIYVQRGLYAAFCERFAARVRTLKVGPGLASGTDIGPLMHARAVAKAKAHVDDAVRRGARCLAGGEAEDGTLFFQPTVLVDVPDEAAIMREETFAPVAPVTSFDDEAEVIVRANASDYGLAAYVVTRDGARALRLGRALDYGMVAVNRVKLTGPPVPFGGVKLSGLGREGSRHGLEAFTDLKYLCLDLS